MTNNIDFYQEAEELLKEVGDIFANESQEIINQRLNLVKGKLEALKTTLVDATQSTGVQRTNARKNLTSVMKIAYQVIMGVRTLLLGANQKITYRLYIKGQNGHIRVVDITEEQLMNVTERSGNTLRLKRQLDNIDNVFNNSDIQTLLDTHFNNIINSFDINGKANYTVKMGVIGEFGDPPNLVWPIDLNGVGKSWRTPKIFNLGWIYQAFDATIYDLYMAQKDHMMENFTISTEDFRRSYFVDHLKYDNVVGFKGGDVGLNQIKGNMASLINATTLIKYLDIILQILTPGSFENKEQLATFIKSKFLDEKETINQDLNELVDKKADELLKVIKI